MPRPPLSVTIISFNEEKNIQRAIQSASWADEIIVVDSGSTDRTVEIAKNSKAKVFHNPWPGYGQQKNFAQSKASFDWVLNIDADEEIPSNLQQEMCKNLEVAENLKISGFSLPRKTFYLGKWIRYGGWYPNYLTRLANKKHSSWTEPHVHEQLQVDGKVAQLVTPLHHYAFESIHDQILTNLRFAKLGSEDLRRRGQKPTLGRLIFKPLGKFFETYFLKKGFLDGLSGFIISINASYSMFLKYAYLIEPRLRK